MYWHIDARDIIPWMATDVLLRCEVVTFLGKMDPMCAIHLSCSYLECPCCLVNVQVEGLAINSIGSLMRILSVDYDSLTHVEGQKFKASCFLVT